MSAPARGQQNQRHPSRLLRVLTGCRKWAARTARTARTKQDVRVTAKEGVSRMCGTRDHPLLALAAKP